MIDQPLARGAAVIGDDDRVDRLEGAGSDEDRLVAGADEALQMGAQSEAGKIGFLAALADHDHAGRAFLLDHGLNHLALAKMGADDLLAGCFDDGAGVIQDGAALELQQLGALFIER